VSLAFGEQVRTDPLASVRLLDEENVDEKPLEKDLAAEPAEEIALLVFRVEPDVLAFRVLADDPVVELAHAPPQRDLSHFLF
jgi:hypothetical protein